MELLGWSDAQINEWALKWDDDLNGRNGSVLSHEDVYYYAVPEIVHASGAKPDGPVHSTLRALEVAIQYQASSPIWLSPVDWNAVRARLNDILVPIGGRLPR